MEQTLLPDGVALAGIIKEKGLRSQPERLTSVTFRVMYVSGNTEEGCNANRKQKPETWDPPSGSVPQAEPLLRSGRGGRRQAPLPTGGWPRVQEPLGGRNGHHWTCLRWVGLLGRGGGHCTPAYREFPDGESAGRADYREHTGPGWTGRGTDTYDNTCPSGGAIECGQEKLLPHTQSERSTQGQDPLVLPRVRQELLVCHQPDAAGLPARSSGRLTSPENHIATGKQASLRGGLSCFVVMETTRVPTSRGGAK
jgi:hypothetical protein